MRRPSNSSGSSKYLSTSSPSVKLSLLGILALLFLNLNASSIILRKSSSSQQQELRSQQEWQPQKSLHKKSSLRNFKHEPTTTTVTHKPSPKRRVCLTETQCNNQRQILNIPPTKYYVGTYPEVYGCYTKNDKLFWSSGGGVPEMAIHPLKGVKERVWCDDNYDNNNIMRDRGRSFLEGEQLIPGVDKYNQKRDAPSSTDDTEDVRVKLHRTNGEKQDDDEEDESEDYGVDIYSKNDIYRMVQETKEGKVNRGKIAWLMRYVFGACERERLCMHDVWVFASNYLSILFIDILKKQLSK